MNPLHELFPKLPPTYEESARKIREQLAAEKLGKLTIKGVTNETNQSTTTGIS